MVYIEDLNKISKDKIAIGVKSKIIFISDFNEYEDRVESVLKEITCYNRAFKQNESILIR